MTHLHTIQSRFPQQRTVDFGLLHFANIASIRQILFTTTSFYYCDSRALHLQFCHVKAVLSIFHSFNNSYRCLYIAVPLLASLLFVSSFLVVFKFYDQMRAFFNQDSFKNAV